MVVTTNHEHGGGDTPLNVARDRYGIEICRMHGLISIVDGAHLPGMMAYDYRELGMDFMAGAAHQWQCGPGHGDRPGTDLRHRQRDPEPGQPQRAAVPFGARACDIWDEIGRQRSRR